MHVEKQVGKLRSEDEQTADLHARRSEACGLVRLCHVLNWKARHFEKKKKQNKTKKTPTNPKKPILFILSTTLSVSDAVIKNYSLPFHVIMTQSH